MLQATSALSICCISGPTSATYAYTGTALCLAQERHGLFFGYLEVPLVHGHYSYDRAPLAVICTTRFYDLNFSFKVLLFNRTFQPLIQVLAAAFFAFAATAYIEDTAGYMR